MRKYRDDMTAEELRLFMEELTEFEALQTVESGLDDESSLAYFDRFIAGDRR